MDQAEQLRNVVKLHNQRNISNARVLTVTSGKGGVGKSNTAVNLAVWFRKMGKRVIIFDADFGLANVEVMFGTVPQYNLSDFIYGNMQISDIITEGPMGIGFISGGSGIVGLNNLSGEQVSNLVHSLSKLNELTDILIIDTGAGVSDSVLDFVLASPEVLLITTPEPSSLTDSYSLIKALYKNPKFIKSQTKIRVIANKVSTKEEGVAVYDKLNSVVSKFLHGNVDFLGIIPTDPALEKAVRSQQVVSMSTVNAKSSKAFEQVANSLFSTEFVDKNVWGISHLFSSFMKK